MFISHLQFYQEKIQVYFLVNTCLTPFVATDFLFINDSPPEVLCQYPGISCEIANNIFNRRENKCFTKKEIEEFDPNNNDNDNDNFKMMNTFKKIKFAITNF
jgi:hypothetical protein